MKCCAPDAPFGLLGDWDPSRSIAVPVRGRSHGNRNEVVIFVSPCPLDSIVLLFASWRAEILGLVIKGATGNLHLVCGLRRLARRWWADVQNER